MNLGADARMGPRTNRYDIGTQLLWLEACLHFFWLLDFLNMDPALRWRGHQHLHAEEIPHEPHAFGLGFTLLNLFVGIPSILLERHRALGNSEDVRYCSALILVGALWLFFVTSKPWHYWVGFGVLTATGISSAHCSGGNCHHAMVQPLPGRTMAVTLSASGFAGFIVAPTINRILTANGQLRQAVGNCAGISVYPRLSRFLFVKERPEDLGRWWTADRAGHHR